MIFSQFMQEIQRGNLPHVFLLAGEERFYIEQALKAITKKVFPDGDACGITKLPATATPREIIEAVETISFFSPTNLVVVDGTKLLGGSSKKKDDAGETDAEDEKKSSNVDAIIDEVGSMPDESYLVFVMESKPDKRRKLAKAVSKAGLSLEAEPLKAWTVEREWLNGKLRELGKTMDAEARSYFLNAVSMMQEISLLHLESEFDKLAMFSTEKAIAKAELVEAFSQVPEVSLFAINEAISEKNATKAVALLERSLKDGQYFAPILSIMERHVRQLWQAKLLIASGVKGKALGKPLGLHPYIAEKVGVASARFSEAQLRRAILGIADADYALKTGGAGDELLEDIVLGLCK